MAGSLSLPGCLGGPGYSAQKGSREHAIFNFSLFGKIGPWQKSRNTCIYGVCSWPYLLSMIILALTARDIGLVDHVQRSIKQCKHTPAPLLRTVSRSRLLESWKWEVAEVLD
jgi:hypothetical protein